MLSDDTVIFISEDLVLGDSITFKKKKHSNFHIWLSYKLEDKKRKYLTGISTQWL